MFDHSTLDERRAADCGGTDDSSQTAYETPQTRRVVLGRAALGLAAVGGAASLAGRATAAPSQDTAAQVLNFIVTQEQFGVTFLTNAVKRAPGTPSEAFLPILKAANTTEFDHVRGLRRIAARPITSRFWIPDAAFGAGGAGLFASIEAVETIELSMYLIGVTTQTQQKSAFGARLMAEAMATESEHRVLARSAQSMLGITKSVPNNISFAPYNLRTVAAVQRAAERLGIGYGKQGATPGRFYDYPGSPLANGTGSRQIVPSPA